MTELAKNYADITGYTQSNNLIDDIGYLTLIDIGQILNIDNGGMARIQLLRYLGPNPIILENIEVLCIGASGTGVSVSSGGYCLLFAPKTPVVDSSKGTVATIYHKYDERTIKALPITPLSKMSVGMTCDGAGVSLNSLAALLRIDTSGISLREASGTCTMSLDKSGNVNVCIGDHNFVFADAEGNIIKSRWDTDGKIFYREVSQPDGTITVFRNMYEPPTDEEFQDMDTYEKWQWKETYMPDGTHDIIQYNSDGKMIYQDTISPDATHDTIWYDGDDNEVYHVKRNPDGSEDTVSVSPFTVTVSDENGKEQVVISGTNDGKLSITTEDSVTVKAKGDVNVSSDGAINIEATQTGLVTLKNSIDSLGSIIGALIDHVNTFSQNVQSIDTVGSPAAHSAGPGIIANMTALQGQLNQLKQTAGKVLG